MSEIRVLIVANAQEARHGYQEALQRLGVSFDVAASFDEVLQLGVHGSYNGMLIDILTLVRSSQEQKLIAYDCINLYPSLRVKWDSKKRQMNLGLLEQSFTADTEGALRYFLEQKCRAFPARSLRRHQRNNVCLHVLLGKRRDFPDDEGVRTFTVNLSRGGAFVHTMHPFTRGDVAWLRFHDFADQTAVQLSVSWILPWGAGRCIPGIGTSFQDLSENQAREIAAVTR